MRKHRNTQHGLPNETANAGPDSIFKKIDNLNIRREVLSFQVFLVDSELGRTRHKVFNSSTENLNATIVDEKLGQFFKILKCGVKLNQTFRFFLKNIENGSSICFYAHESKTLLDQSKLVRTRGHSTKLKYLFNETGITELCSRERINTTWILFKLTKLTAFADLVDDEILGCKEAV